jgi:peptidoglycan/xylan/chitin deacetylase (PgdA/CDA1 family)
VKKRLLFLLSIFLFLLILNPQQKAIATNQPGEYFLVETSYAKTYIRRGAEKSYAVKAVIPSHKKIIVIGEFVNSKKKHWLHIKYNGVIGWIEKSGQKNLQIKNQFLVSSASTTSIKKGNQKTDKQIGVIQKGQIVRTNDVFTESNGDRWIQVTSGKITGWVPLSNMELFDGGKNYLNRQLLIKKDTHVRRGASSKEKSVYLIKKGTQVTIQSSFNVNGETWYRIKSGKISGWIPAGSTTNKLSFSTYLYTKQNSSMLRGADKSYRAVSTIPIGQKVRTTTKFISGEKKIWYKVQLGNGKSGWVMGTSLSAKKIKIVYLTIDDGPSRYTSRLLDTLNKYHVKATFFMINGNMNAHKANVKRMIREGHTIGSHSVTHDKNKFYRSPSSALNEMITTRRTILKITGIKSNLMRVPYGSVPYMKQSYRNAVKKQDFIMWDWNVDSLDWKFNNSRYVSNTLSQVKRIEKKRMTPVILIHDRKATVDSLPLLLSNLKKQGYTFAPINKSIKPYQFSVR